MKTSELVGPALDWAVCEAAGLFKAYPKVKKAFRKMWLGNSSYYLHPSTDWSNGGPIIEREHIRLMWTEALGVNQWSALVNGLHCAEFGPTPLIAAMRCYVASKLGDDVEIPEDLL